MGMRTQFPKIVLAVSVGLLSGCAAWEQHMRDALPAPQPAYVNREIVVAPTRSLYAVRYEGADVLPSRDSRARIASFLDQASPNKTSVVLVEQPGRGSPRLKRQRAVELTRFVRSLGYRTDVLAEGVGNSEPDTLQIALDHTLAMVPGCPDWQFHKYETFGAQPLPNMGCADRTNLASMVANPNDLVAGAVPDAPSGDGPLYGELRYRINEVTPVRDATAASDTSSN